MKKLSYAVAALIFMLFFGCSEKKPQINVTPSPMPSWYTDAPTSNSTTLYAVGEGVDKQSALNDALANMASSLSVSVASQYRSRATEKRTHGQSETSVTVTQAIETEVKKIRISNYRILKSTEQSFRRCLVLVSAEKHDVFSALRSELDQQLLQMRTSVQAFKHTNALQRLGFYRAALGAREKAENTLLVLTILDPRFDATAYQQDFNRMEQDYHALKNRISFSVEQHSNLAARLAPVIRQGITAEHLSVGRQKGNDHFTVRIETRTEDTTAMGFFLSRSAIDLQVLDVQGNIIGSRKLNLIGQSSQSAAIAQEDVAVKLKKLLQKEGIYHLLGLENSTD